MFCVMMVILCKMLYIYPNTDAYYGEAQNLRLIVFLALELKNVVVLIKAWTSVTS